MSRILSVFTIGVYLWGSLVFAQENKISSRLQALMSCYVSVYGGAWGGPAIRLHDDPKNPSALVMLPDDKGGIKGFYVYTSKTVYFYSTEQVKAEAQAGIFAGYTNYNVEYSVPPHPGPGEKAIRYQSTITASPEGQPSFSPGGSHDAREKDLFQPIDGKEALDAAVMDRLRDLIEFRIKEGVAKATEKPDHDGDFTTHLSCNRDCRFEVALAKKYRAEELAKCAEAAGKWDEKLNKTAQAAASTLQRLQPPPSILARESFKDPFEHGEAGPSSYYVGNNRIRPLEAQHVQALTEEETKEIQDLISNLGNPDKTKGASEKLKELGIKASPALRMALESENETTRTEALRTLEAIMKGSFEYDGIARHLVQDRPRGYGYFFRPNVFEGPKFTTIKRTDPWREQIVRVRLPNGELSEPLGRDWFLGDKRLKEGDTILLNPTSGSKEDQLRVKEMGLKPKENYPVVEVYDEEYLLPIANVAPARRGRGRFNPWQFNRPRF